jgi:hypothetical protein
LQGADGLPDAGFADEAHRVGTLKLRDDGFRLGQERARGYIGGSQS